MIVNKQINNRNIYTLITAIRRRKRGKGRRRRKIKYDKVKCLKLPVKLRLIRLYVCPIVHVLVLRH